MRLSMFIALLAGTVLSGRAHADEVATHWRLFVADKTEARVSVLDLTDESVAETFALAAPASLYAQADGSGVFAVQGSANVVTAIRSGIEIEDHGEHADLKVGDPELVTSTVEGERPVHLVEHGGDIAIFFDGSGKVALINGKAWQNDSPRPTEFDSGKAHHGVAVPWHGGAIISRRVPGEEALPSGFLVFDDKGDLVSDTELCADVHGEATSGDMLAFGCSDGVLVASGITPGFQLLAYPEDEGQRVGTLLGGKHMQYFLANYGARTVALIEPDAADPYRFVDLPFDRVHFVLDDARPRFAYILLANGVVHELDVVAGTLGRSVAVTDPYATDGEHSAAMPRLAVAGETLVVSDPAQGRLHLIDTASFTLAGAIDVGGVPSSVVAVGGSGTAH